MRKTIACMAVIFLVLLFMAGCGKNNDNIVAGDSNGTNDTINNTINTSLGGITGNVVSDRIDDLIVQTPDDEANYTDNSTDDSGEDTAKGDLIVSFIDVSHGDSVFIQTPNNGTLLIDGGSNYYGATVMKYLQNCGIFYYLDAMLATNPGDEHIGGLGSVLYNMISVSEVYDNGCEEDTQSYQAFRQFSMAKGALNTITEDTEINVDDDVDVQVIVPYMDGYLEKTGDNSLVVKITYGDTSLLLMGDCGYECEQNIMGHDLKADILDVAHSGHNDSTSAELLDEVDPDYAIISTGDYNEFNDPSPDVLLRLEEKGINVLRTDLNGTIVVRSDGKTYDITTSK